MWKDWARLRVRFGFGSGPFEASPTWVDVTDEVRDTSFTFETGRTSRGGDVQASTVAFTLGNSDGRYTPFLNSSPYWPLDEGFPCLVDVEYPKDSGTYYPVWGGVSYSAEAGFEGAAAGVATIGFQQRWARAGQTVLPALVVGIIEALQPDGFWPMSDVAGSDTASDQRRGDYPKLTAHTRGTGSVEFGVGDAPGDTNGTRVLVDSANNTVDGAVLVGDWDGDTVTDFVAAAVFETSGFNTGFWSDNLVFTFNSRINVWLKSDGTLKAEVSQPSVGVVASAQTVAAIPTNDEVAIVVSVEETAGTSTLTLTVNGETLTDTFTTFAMDVSSLHAGAAPWIDGSYSFFSNATFANVAYWTNTTNLAAIRDVCQKSVTTFGDETGDTKFREACLAAKIPTELVETTGAFDRLFAEQTIVGRTLADVLAEVEECEVGRITHTAGGELELRSAQNTNQEVGVELDATKHFTFEGTIGVDSDGMVNDFTGSRIDGPAQRVVAEDELIRKRGAKAAPAADDLPLTTDGDVVDVLAWKVNTLKRPTLRLPSLRVFAQKLHDDDLFDDFLRLREGDRVRLTNLPASLGSTYDGVIDNQRALIDGDQFVFAPTLAAWRPVVEVEHDEYGRIGPATGTVILDGAIDADDTTLVVTTTDIPYTDDVPFDVDISGERLTVTAVDQTVSPQTFTVTRAVAPSRPAAHDAGEPVELWDAAIIPVRGTYTPWLTPSASLTPSATLTPSGPGGF